MQKAVAALLTTVGYWVLLVLAHQRSGDVHAARAVVAEMRAQGFAAAQLAQYEQELNEPTPEDLQALVNRPGFRGGQLV
jgi:hypothetical protein